METRDDGNFIKRVERLIDPEEVADIAFIQRLKRLLPPSLFKRALYAASGKYPRIGFVIEPYSLFLFFRLKDLALARSLVPARYELVKTRVVEGDEPDYYHGMGILNTRGSTFGGVRLESYLVARDRETGLVSWIFIDILSNTLMALPKTGVADRNSSGAVFTTNSRGDFIVDIAEDGTGRRVSLRGNMRRGTERVPDRPLWVGGNTSIAYADRLSGGDDAPFAVIFDPAEVDSTLEIPIGDVNIEENSLRPELAETLPCKVICFPFAQHYVADSPGRRTFVRDEADLVAKYDAIAAAPAMATFSARGIRRLLAAGIALSLLCNVVLALALIFSRSS